MLFDVVIRNAVRARPGRIRAIPMVRRFFECVSGGHAISAEDRQHRLTLDLRRQVAVSPPHLFRDVTKHVVDDPLIDASRGQAGCDRMAERVQAAYHLPFRSGQRSLEMVVAFSDRERPRPWQVLRFFTVAMRPLSVVARPLPFWWPVVRLRFLLWATSPDWQNSDGRPGGRQAMP